MFFERGDSNLLTARELEDLCTDLRSWFNVLNMLRTGKPAEMVWIGEGDERERMKVVRDNYHYDKHARFSEVV